MDLDDTTIDRLLERVMPVERRFADIRKGQHSERRSRVREVIEKFSVEATTTKSEAG